MVDTSAKVDNILSTLESKHRLQALGELLQGVYGDDNSSMFDSLIQQLYSIKSNRESDLDKSNTILTELISNHGGTMEETTQRHS